MAKKTDDTVETIEKKTVGSEKLKALQLTLDKLEKTYGKGTVMKLGDSAVEALWIYFNWFIRIRYCLRNWWFT
jgi:hypothetical protein